MSVDSALFGDGDFIQVRAALIAEVGAVEAIVLSRIHYRATEAYREAYKRDSYWWWRAPVSVIAEETGLTEKQVRRALDVLAEAGHLIAEQHHVEGAYDRAKSFRVALDEGQMHLPQRANEDLPQRANVPIVKTVEDTPPTPSANDRKAEAFEAAWMAWPNKNGKKLAKQRWMALSLTQLDEVIPILVAHANAHRQHTAPRYIPHLSTWLNQERWNDQLPASGERGAHKPEPQQGRQGIVIPAGHVVVRDPITNQIIGTRPADER